MPTTLALPVFLASLAVTLGAARFFAERLDHVGLRLGLPETLLGLLTALAADAPEVSSALAALVKGEHGVAVGVVVGSNAFNLAAMLGLTTILASGIHLRREALMLEGFVALWVTLVVSVFVAGGLGAPAALALVGAVVAAYIALLALGPRGVARLSLPAGPRRFLRHTFGEGHRPERPPAHGETVLLPVLTLLPALAIIVVGSTGMVEAALDLANAWSLPHTLVGVLVLAVLTSLPNAATAVRLGLQGRGSALVSETFNSNSINLVAGMAIPAVLTSLGALSALDTFDLVWLAVMTGAALALLVTTRPGRATGVILIGLYSIFVAVQLVAQS